jgi:hypothetical protein
LDLSLFQIFDFTGPTWSLPISVANLFLISWLAKRQITMDEKLNRLIGYIERVKEE